MSSTDNGTAEHANDIATELDAANAAIAEAMGHLTLAREKMRQEGNFVMTSHFLGEEREKLNQTHRYLAGESRDWHAIATNRANSAN